MPWLKPSNASVTSGVSPQMRPLPVSLLHANANPHECCGLTKRARPHDRSDASPTLDRSSATAADLARPSFSLCLPPLRPLQSPADRSRYPLRSRLHPSPANPRFVRFVFLFIFSRSSTAQLMSYFFFSFFGIKWPLIRSASWKHSADDKCTLRHLGERRTDTMPLGAVKLYTTDRILFAQVFRFMYKLSAYNFLVSL